MPLSVDVLVVGGGPAGVAAAVAARLAGADRVMLVEPQPVLGGAVTMAMHRVLCGLYAQEPADAADTLNAGVQRSIITQLAKRSPKVARPMRMGQAWVLPFVMEDWGRVLQDQLRDHGVTAAMRTRVTAVHRAGRRIEAVRLADDQAGNQAGWVQPRAIIDCAAGRLLALAGADTFTVDPPDARMMGGHAWRLTGLTGDASLLRLQIPYTLTRAVEAGQLPAAARLTMFHPGPGQDEGVCKLAVPPGEFLEDGDEAVQAALVTRGEAMLTVLRRELPAMAQARVVERSPFALARDGRRLRGRAMVTRQQVIQGDDPSASSSSSDAQAVRAWWPVERWDDGAAGPTYTYGPVGRPYVIPPDALRSEAMDHLYAAGLSVSAETDAAASLRASGICLATGAAAGRLAADARND